MGADTANSEHHSFWATPRCRRPLGPIGIGETKAYATESIFGLWGLI